MKRGFTLIELLAVIVILAIISLIATPIVLSIIEDTKQSATLRSVENILYSSELYASKSLMNSAKLNGNIYEEVMKEVNGEKPDNGVIYANNKGEVAFSFKYSDYCYTKGYNDKEIKVEKTDTCIVPIDYLKIQEQTNDANVEFFDGPITKGLVEKVVTLTTNIVPEEAKDTSWDVSQAQNGSIMAWYLDEDSNGYYELYIGQEGGVKANPDSSKLFNYFINVTEIDLSNLDTSNVTTMQSMFYKCKSLTSLDLSGFNTSNVTDMLGMFAEMSSITSLDLSSFNTRNVTTMRAMFQACINLTSLDLSSFETSNVTNMNYMFVGMSSIISLDLSNFDTRNVTDMQVMFALMSSITSLDLSSFETSNVTNMKNMFYETNALQTIKLNKATFKSLTNNEGMFTNSTVSNITVKDNEAKTFIEARLTDAGITATVIVN